MRNSRIDHRAKKLVGVNTKQTSPEVASKAGGLVKSLGSQPRKTPLGRNVVSVAASALSQTHKPKNRIGLGKPKKRIGLGMR